MNQNSTLTGQAMTEMLVFLTLLVPLFLLMPLMGKYVDMQHTMNNAARYGAWEYVAQQDLWDELPSVRGGRDNNSAIESNSLILAEQIRQRFFFHPLNGITEHDNSVHNQTWRDHAGDTLLTFNQGEPVEPTVQVEQVLPADDGISWADTRLRWTLEPKSLVWVRVDMPVNPFPWPGDFTLPDAANRMRASAALIADSMVPGNEEDFTDRVREIRKGEFVRGFPKDLRQFVQLTERQLEQVGFGQTAAFPVNETIDAVLTQWQMVPDEQSQILPAERQAP